MKQLQVVEEAEAPHVKTSKTRWLVAQLAAFGLDEAQIAYAAGIKLADLKLNYAAEMDNGLAVVTAKVGVALVKQARKGDTNAQRFWLQARGRWVVPTKVELTGKDGGPVEIEHRRKTIDSIVSLVRKRTAVKQEAPLTPPVSRETSKEAGGGEPPVQH